MVLMCQSCLEDVTKLISEDPFAAHVKKHARCVYDTSVEKITTPSDLANVRFSSQSVLHKNMVEDPVADAVAEGESLAPNLASVGLFHLKPQEMGAVLEGIHRIVTEAKAEMPRITRTRQE